MAEIPGLHDVPWERLHHAYGPATDVPALLQALMSPEVAEPELVTAAARNNRSVFDHVVWTLWGNVFHQGSVWQVTAHVVPLLAHILRHGPDSAAQQAFLICYLRNLAIGYHEDLFPNDFDPKDEFEAVAGQTDPGTEPDYSANDLRPLIWMRDTYDAVAHEIGTILPFLDAPEDSVADEAIAFCAAFPEQTDRTLPALRKVAEGPDRRAAMAAITLSSLHDTRTIPLARKLTTAPDSETALLATCAIAIADPKQVELEDVLRLTQLPDELSKKPLAHAGNIGRVVARCVANLHPDYADHALTGLCQQLAEANPITSVSLTESMLRLVFHAAPPAQSQDLTDRQRKALEAIRDHGHFKVSGHIFGNYGGLLRSWGLPQTAEDLDKWLRKKRFFGLWG